jgi:hypothetical protein
LYRTVHRSSHFKDALASLDYAVENRPKGQNLEVHCVLTKDNFMYAQEWWDFFESYAEEGVRRVLSPLVASEFNEPSLECAQGLPLDMVQKRILEVAGLNGRMWTNDTVPFPDPCVLWHNCSFDVEGYFLQCCNWAPVETVNYGTIPEFIEEGRRLKDVWMERLANRMRNPLCRSCNMRASDWQERLDRMKIRCSC